ncbi:MAG: hypothetical protein D6753_14650 [Planctomycetota bacterium]|nr:MAG: hypothetical protein D6753_14650 [Planctomycetota bacterium]
MMQLPMLSVVDPRVSAEGSIDPLGMYAIADALAVRLVPGVRERQMHPRFLTAIAVSLSLCSDFDEDVVAADGVSEPWQVFEWYVVEGLVRTTSDRSLLRGLPGQDKAARASREGVPLSQKRYLKTPNVFGFHGVYRALARDVGIEVAGRLGQVGYELLTAWEKEQGLDGFCSSVDGPGKVVRRQLHEAIVDGLRHGAVARKTGWAGWSFFSDHLGIYDVGQKESQLIARALMHASSGFRGEILHGLIRPAGWRLWWKEVEQRTFSERRFHQWLAPRASPQLQQLLGAIDAYERFCRLLQDAFDDCMFRLSQYQQRITAQELEQLDGVQRAARRIPDLFAEVSEKLSPFDQTVRFEDTFASLAERVSSRQWVERLLNHHCRIQLAKPPAGKAPWFDRFDDGSFMIRTGYLTDQGGRHDEAYVHAYRTRALSSFARDLRLVS